MLPVAAVGRTAVAVGALADCRLVVAMTRGRVWIGVLGALLGGIVALNVWGLGLSAASSGTAARVDALQRENSVLRARIAKRLSNDRIERQAAELGLSTPAPDDVTYLEWKEGDAARAAERLRSREIAPASPVAAPEDPAATIDPATGLPVDPAATVDPATGLPVDPAATIDPATGLPVDPAAVATAPPTG